MIRIAHLISCYKQLLPGLWNRGITVVNLEVAWDYSSESLETQMHGE